MSIGSRPPGPPRAPRRDSGSRPRPEHDDWYGPIVVGEHRRRGFWWLLRMAAVGVLVLAVLAAGTGVGLLLYTSARLQRVPVSGLSPAIGQLNVLIVGTDSREGLTPEELQALDTTPVEGNRTDTILLLSVSGGRAAMLSFPRDLFVTRCDGTQGRINTAHSIGGASCLVDTVTRLSGVPVTNYVEVNFVGFWRIVNAVGGVSVFLEEPLRDPLAGIDLPAGCVTLSGQQALGFVRARQVDSDLGRIARQQRFIAELADELTAPSTLVNVPRLFGVAGSAASATKADQGTGTLDLLRMARGARGLAGAGVATHTVPASPATVGGAAVLVPTDAAAGLFTQFRDGSILRPQPVPEPPAPDQAPPPADAPAGPAPPVGAAPPPPEC